MKKIIVVLGITILTWTSCDEKPKGPKGLPKIEKDTTKIEKVTTKLDPGKKT